MQHQKPEQLKAVAELGPFPSVMSRRARLERWAELLERAPARRLATLHGTEYQPSAKRAAMRSEGSALTVAFEDPILRDEGLKDDTYGEAKRFFELSDWQLHEIVCYCHFGDSMSADCAARQVRAAIEPGKGGMFARLREVISG